jgi:hypothetical protein
MAGFGVGDTCLPPRQAGGQQRLIVISPPMLRGCARVATRSRRRGGSEVPVRDRNAWSQAVLTVLEWCTARARRTAGRGRSGVSAGVGAARRGPARPAVGCCRRGSSRARGGRRPLRRVARRAVGPARRGVGGPWYGRTRRRGRGVRRTRLPPVGAEAAATAARLHREAGRPGAALASTTWADGLRARCAGVRTPRSTSLHACAAHPREREVAGLTARGMSDRDIAARLQVSVRTVRDVSAPGSPGADLVVVQAGFVLRGLVALLDRPPGPGDAHQLAQRCGNRGGAVVEGQLPRRLAVGGSGLAAHQ